MVRCNITSLSNSMFFLMLHDATAMITIPVRILCIYLPQLLAVFQSLNFLEKREDKIFGL